MAETCLLEVTTLAASALPDAVEGWLSPAEQTRLLGIQASLRRRQYLAGHWLARVLSARAFGGEPAQWRWDDEAGPRPQLLRGGVRAWATLSHSGEHLAAAVAAQPIGLDLELPRRPRDVMALARYLFAPDEIARLLEVEAGAERERLFYVFWALKEARGKRGGEGLQATQARRVSSRRSDAALAEARVWPLGDTGALALAGWPGLVPQARGLPEGLPASHWTYVAAD
ncbi:4'-phosphopantetheinyl transferase family protein [Arenimonas terrae]|uniref:4'-phosphopantetheinyl transferase superfamily protein n=1 Tax=Arenimonas terrae TaxID=2546226 RepID=A0A5C4RUI4_9GAMM|nr:4'-phosphopantetheinyl transferase superfamily protein [Arenimonas terrae]TNJ34658.1 4'-phosphopantetheinyl transferase superfamily protein [Arenimonas terrae]